MENSVAKARHLFNTAHLKKDDCKMLMELAKTSENFVIRGYYAAAMMVSSKYLINPFKISKVFNEGKELLEDLISENFDDIEIRYLRYTIQLNTPKFVGYFKNVEQDRVVLIDYIKHNPETELTSHMMVFIKDTNDAILKFI